MAITINGTTGIAGVDGSASTPAVQGTDTNTGIFFPAADTIAFGDGGTESMRIDSSSRLLVGTSTSVAVDVINSKAQIEHTNYDASLTVKRNSNGDGGPLHIFVKSRGTSNGSNTVVQSGDTLGQLRFFGTDGTDPAEGASIIAQVDGTPGNNDMPGRLIFSTTADGSDSPTERARITSAGRFCINTTYSDTQLNIAYNGSSIRGVDINNTVSSNQDAIYFRTNGTNVGRINTDASNTSYVTSSDYRLKENVLPMTGALEKLAQLKPCTWTWKVNGAAGQGFIAHELAEVCPDAVVGEKDAVEIYTDDEGNEQTRPRYQGVDTSFLVATLTAAIQELKSELDAAKARIAVLEAK